jgi:hypothetical protein
MTRMRAWAIALGCWLLPAVALAGIDDTYVKPGGRSWAADWFEPIFHGDDFGKSYALVVGVGDYDGYRDLEAPANDALRVRDFLKDAGFDEIITLTDDKATFERINGLMEDEFPAKVTSRDRFLFYFSGHGETRTLAGGKRGYLVLKPAPRRGWSRMVDMPKVCGSGAPTCSTRGTRCSSLTRASAGWSASSPRATSRARRWTGCAGPPTT